ncbi:MAG: tRNA (adenosine(37)-N6)-threonylcarbamoyltransferase complex dimerization subunit type 1 TsaB [Dehalococcoidales bacterium]|jgi:tRNA threonylcarbamoyladenosine biosynthesis protein TsaB|nr:tRNA (adenosine(37)-N6)-threonylcarbamoyltransferase complex dimerization subunit type 1 TsaB [Dehalococcoidales bacterium]MDP6577300.1 tRNA (adenosine(37)-N6)-threonylcarbamoyltransferase complex dimerization subunit type 1 TsaB [Dehalococcoidales bacterium]
MKILGIDTSGYTNAVGVVDGDRVLADFKFTTKNDSLEKIVAHIDSTLKEARLTLEDMEGFGVGLGPGSWTGIRVGVTVAKILAYSAGRPVAGVPTLEVLAYMAGKAAGLICPIIDAGAGGTIYAAFYRMGNGAVHRTSEYYVGDVPGLAGRVKEPVTLTGLGAQDYRWLIGQVVGSSVSIKAKEETPGGAAVAWLAKVRLACGEDDDVLSLTPLYLKESTARAFRNKYARTGSTEN